jgi:hypothetical protein
MNTKFMLARRVSRNVCLTAFLSLPLVMMPTYAQAEESSGTADAFAQTQSAQPAADKSIDGGQPRLEGQPTLEPVLFHDASVSMPSLEPSPFIKKSVIAPMTRLKGYADVSEYTPDPSQLIQDLVDVAVARDKEKDLLEQSAKFHNKTWTKVLGRSKGMLQYATSYQGFESSSEGADIILEEKLKLKNASAVEFVRQKKMDAAHLQITCAVMEMATGLGLNDESRREQTIRAGVQEMSPLVGEEQAEKSLKQLTAWSKNVKSPEDSFLREPWDVLAMRQKSREILANSLRDDDVVKSIETRLHKFNRHNNLSRATSKFVNTTLSLVAFSPTFASPAAQAAQFVYIACTGGPEEKKLLKEVYLDRCFESRFERLSQESMMSINNYNCAVLTHNPVLSACTQAIIDKLTSPELGATITSVSAPNAQSQQVLTPKVFGERI